MPKTPTPNPREAASAGAILWSRSLTEYVAPDELGGQTAAEQERIVRERIHADGLTLDRILYCVGTPLDSEDRLRQQFAALEQAPIRRVYVSAAIYANDTDDELYEHKLRHKLADMRLTICESE